MVSILGWVLMAGGTFTLIMSLAKNSLEIYWLRFLTIGIAVVGFGILKATGAL